MHIEKQLHYWFITENFSFRFNNSGRRGSEAPHSISADDVKLDPESGNPNFRPKTDEVTSERRDEVTRNEHEILECQKDSDEQLKEDSKPSTSKDSHSEESGLQGEEAELSGGKANNDNEHCSDAQSDGRYRCPVCPQSFKCKRSLKPHLKRHQIPKKFICRLCKHTFTKFSELDQHRVLSHKTCKKCERVFTYSSDVKRHTCTTQSSDLPFQCTFCTKAFSKQKTQNIHQRRHTGSLPFKCIKCPKTFLKKSQLARHTLVHVEERPHQCSHCSKGFTSVWKLREHSRLHESGKFICYICHNEYHSQWYLESHIKVSHQGMEMTCTKCPRTFYDIYKLREHLRSHDVVKKHECLVCRKEFSTGTYLRMHNRRVHREHKCPKCDKMIHGVYTFREHISAHENPKKFVCDICQQELPGQFHLNRHFEKTHKEQSCPSCSETFTSLPKYRKHVKTHISPKCTEEGVSAK